MQKITNMAGERILYRIERDLGLTIAAIFLGLIYSSGDTRGYPVPWLGPEGPDAVLFLLSLLIIFCTVFFIDLLVTAVLLIREPSADRQTAETSVIVNSVDYAEYEDGYDKEYSYTDASDYGDEDEDELSVRSMFRDLGLKDRSERNTSCSVNDSEADTVVINESDYIPALVENKAAVRKEQKKADKNSGRKSTATGSVFFYIVIAITLFGFTLGVFEDSDDDYIDDWDTENITIEDDSYEDDSSVNYNKMFDLASEAIYNIGDDDYSQLYYLISDNVKRADFDNLTSSSDIHWSELWFRDELGNVYSGDGKHATVVYRLQDGSDNTYIAAFDYTGDDVFRADEDDNAAIFLTGFSVYPDLLISEDFEDVDFTGLSEQESQEILDNMDSDVLSIGKSTSHAEDVMQIIYPDDM